jgi:hypothetical protein
MCKVWWFDGDLDGHWLFVNDRERHMLLVVDWTIDWDVDGIRHGLFNDIRDLLDDLVGLGNWNFHGHSDLLLDMNWVRSVWEDRITDWETWEGRLGNHLSTGT